jgi:hypothetical protein
MTILTKEEAHRLFEYRDGQLFWKIRPKHSRKSKDDTLAGTITTGGYFRLTIKQKKFYVHQIIFLMQHGYIPKLIDHIDGNPSNNRIENLRESSKSLNACNSKRPIHNSSGHKGVMWEKRQKRWIAKIQINKKVIHLGSFVDIELASLVADEARILYHGKHARI